MTHPNPTRGLARRVSAGLSSGLADYQGPGFVLKLWDETAMHVGSGPPRFVMTLKSAEVLRDLLWDANEITLGDAFVGGDLEVDGDLFAVFPFAEFVCSRMKGTGTSLARRGVAAAASGWRQVRYRANYALAHSLSRDRRAIAYHYDRPPEFFAPWLGPTMVYSCAYFRRGAESLEEAQWNKLDLICRKLRLHAGERLLDIGCGWGSLIAHAAKYYGVRAVGITLSQEQAAFAQLRLREMGLENVCEARLCDYRELTAEAGGFDKIASVGMFEHVGGEKLGGYFECVFRLLKRGGAFLNHGIVESDTENRRRGPTFIRKYVFPDTELATLTAVIGRAEEAGFEVRDVECLREHYERTLHDWVDRLERGKQELLRYVNEETYRIWRLYMAGSAEAFRSAKVSVYQVLLADPKTAQHTEPQTREDWMMTPRAPRAQAS
jgi:cyclopropane-fatty-acyl-phospholipid synthase